MSKIFEALRSAEAASKAEPRSTKPAESSIKKRDRRQGERRRGERRAFDSVLRVYGSTPDGEPFYEDAHTINVSAHGALLEMSVPVSVGQKLMLINEGTDRQQICKIVKTRTLDDTEALEVGVEFPVPHAEFWRVFSGHRETGPSENGPQPGMDVAGITVGV
jgi:PilZ domain-containing protein